MPSASRSGADAIEAPEYDEDFLALAIRIRDAATDRKAVRKEDVAAAISGLDQYASIRGLTSEALELLVDTLTKKPCHLDQTTTSRVIRLLVPRGKVSVEIVLLVVGCLGPGANRPQPALQAALLRWLVMVYDLLEDHTILSQLYGIMFNLLDMMSLRPSICHLLSLVTRRKHIKPFRIQALLELKRDIGNEQPLNALLQVYKNYYPDIIVGDAGPFKSGLFSHPNPEWMEMVLTIQEAYAASDAGRRGKTKFVVVRHANGQASKRRKTDRAVIPEVHTLQTTESSVTLEEVRNADDFVQKLDKLELPNQLAAVLDDTLLQNLLALRPSVTSDHRINNWLTAALEDDLLLSKSPTSGASARTDALLSRVAKYTHSTRKMLPSVELYLRKFLSHWDGKSHVKPVLELASFLPLREFETLHTNFLKPIETVLSSGGDEAAANLLGFHTALLRNWAISHSGRSLEDEETLEVKALCLQRFVKHVGSICLGLFREPSDTAVIANATLSFYECASSLPWDNSLFRIVLPPDAVVYYYLFIGDVVMFSRLCSVLVRYKNALEPTTRATHDQATAIHFNGFIMDICNCIWRNRAFAVANDKDNRSALACTIPENVIEVLKTAGTERGTELKNVFSFSYSPFLARFSAEYFHVLEKAAGAPVKHQGPVNFKSLQYLEQNGGMKLAYADYRSKVLNHLKEKGFVGISDFMYATMMSLRQPGTKVPTVPVAMAARRKKAV